MASEATPLLGGDGGDASAAVGLPPVLKAMVGLDGPVYVGSEVASRLSFSSLIDLLPGAKRDGIKSNAIVARTQRPLPSCERTRPRNACR